MIGIVWIAFIVAAAFIAKNKGRPVWEGILWGLFLGLIGVLIELCMPSKSVASAVPLTAVPGAVQALARQAGPQQRRAGGLAVHRLQHPIAFATWAIPA